MLEEVRDTNDNYISYSYYKDSGQIYPSAIKYTGNGSTDGIFEIDFQRESRSDTATSWQTGFGVKTLYRINEIDAKVNGTLVHKHVLGYTMGANGRTSLLGSIEETAYDESSNPTTLPAAVFKYQSNTPNWTSDSSWNLPVAIQDDTTGNLGYKFADVNGDGLTDLLGNDVAYINNGHNWTSDSSWIAPVDFSKDKNGTQYTYGSTLSTRMDDPSNSDDPFVIGKRVRIEASVFHPSRIGGCHRGGSEFAV